MRKTEKAAEVQAYLYYITNTFASRMESTGLRIHLDNYKNFFL